MVESLVLLLTTILNKLNSISFGLYLHKLVVPSGLEPLLNAYQALMLPYIMGPNQILRRQLLY